MIYKTELFITKVQQTGKNVQSEQNAEKAN